MKSKKLVTIFLLLFSISCFAQHVPMIKAKQLMARLHVKSDTTYVVNFWATWCAPCVKEMPYFQQINKEYAGTKVKVLLISINFPRELDSLLIPYVKKHHIKAEVALLDELNMDYFVPLISKQWHDADIPATMFINNQKGVNEFYQKEMTLPFLESKIKAITGKK